MEETRIVCWNEAYARMMTSLRRYVTQLQAKQVIDSLGRVTALVNPQAVLATGFTIPIDMFLDDPPKDTIMPVSYLEGLPTIGGVPIWELLEGEKVEYYELFKRYRSMKDAKTQRTVYKLALETGMEVKQLELIRQTYHWGIRVEAYDEYLRKEREVQLELRRIEIEGKHAKTAEALYKISADYLTGHPEAMNPKVALQMLELAIRLERISSGMSPDNKGTTSIPQVAIQNNINAGPVAEQKTVVEEGSLTDKKQRLSQVLNIMNNIGLLNQDKEVIEVEPESDSDEVD